MTRYIFKIVFQVKGNNDYMGAPNQKPSQRLTLAKDFQTKNRFKKLTWLWIFKPKTVSKSWLGYGFASQKPFQKVDLAMDLQAKNSFKKLTWLWTFKIWYEYVTDCAGLVLTKMPQCIFFQELIPTRFQGKLISNKSDFIWPPKLLSKLYFKHFWKGLSS